MKVALFGAELAQFINARSLQRFEETDARVNLDDADDALVADLATVFGWSRNVPERLLESGLAGAGGTRLTPGYGSEPASIGRKRSSFSTSSSRKGDSFEPELAGALATTSRGDGRASATFRRTRYLTLLEPRVHGLALERKHRERALVNAT